MPPSGWDLKMRGKNPVNKGKERIDLLLVQKGLAPSREKAKALIMAGQVYLNEQRLDKPGMEVPAEAEPVIKGESLPFVSRGGLKLAKAIESFGLSFQGKTVADIGSSTGGFTDCALQNGAERVYAIDVGYGQLHWKLRQDSRVISMERTNARHLTDDSLPEKVDWVVSDVAFISITKVFSAIDLILKEKAGQIMCLIKPQFEAGREFIGKKGVVRDPEVHKSVLAAVIQSAAGHGFYIQGLDYSPVRGPEGNIEYLAWFSLIPKEDFHWQSAVEAVVEGAQTGTS